MPLQTNEPIGANALEMYKAINQTILDLITDPATKKYVAGKGYEVQDLDTLRKMREELRKECETRGLIAVDLRSSKVGVGQAFVRDYPYHG
jgi:hypothetical protein